MLIELLTKKYPGMRQWLAQRLSAVYLALYTFLLVTMLLIKQPADFTQWQAFFAPWWWRLLTLLMFISLAMHAWLGVRDVLKDYIFNVTLRGYLQLLVDVVLIIDLVWVSTILWNIN
ncbi:MAG TPA: succinate dehydrogenase, hydrophobic membrane anchor protein [Methylophilus sp.]